MSSISIFCFEGTTFKEIADIIIRLNHVEHILKGDNSKSATQIRQICDVKIRWVRAYSVLATLESIIVRLPENQTDIFIRDIQHAANLMTKCSFSFKEFLKNNTDLKTPLILQGAEHIERSAQNLRAVSEELSTNKTLDFTETLRRASKTTGILVKKSDQYFFDSAFGKYYMKVFRGSELDGNIRELRA